MQRTKIEWTDYSWNPLRARLKDGGKSGTFCTRISPGCANCYASTINKRFGNGLEYTVPNLEKVEFFLDDKILAEPVKRKKPARIFVGDMFDLFHETIPLEMIGRVFAAMHDAPQHTFQLLTKRADRMLEFMQDWDRSVGVEPNIWAGVSVESQKYADERIPHLLQTPAAVRFLSVEPQLEAVNLRRYLNAPNRSGVGDLQIRPERNIRDRQIGQSLEDAKREDIEPHTLHPAASGAHGSARVSPSASYGERQADSCRGASPSVAAFQRRDTARTNGESQERTPERESAGQPGVGDLLGATRARMEGFAESTPRRGAQSEREAHGSKSADHSTDARERSNPPRDFGSSERFDSASVSNRTGRPLGLSWIIVGGESGPGARPFNLAWAENLLEQCRAAGVPFFMKQVGSNPFWDKSGPFVVPMHDRKGGDPAEWPEHLRVREFPKVEVSG